MCATTVRRIHCCLASTSAVRRLCATLAGAVPKCHWDTHKLSIDGLVDNPTTFSMDDLYAMPSREIPVTLVCAGNRRKEENLVKQTIGFNWGAAGVSTSVWKGNPNPNP